jgi:hypothetical protein
MNGYHFPIRIFTYQLAGTYTRGVMRVNPSKSNQWKQVQPVDAVALGSSLVDRAKLSRRVIKALPVVSGCIWLSLLNMVSGWRCCKQDCSEALHDGVQTVSASEEAESTVELCTQYAIEEGRVYHTMTI